MTFSWRALFIFAVLGTTLSQAQELNYLGPGIVDEITGDRIAVAHKEEFEGCDAVNRVVCTQLKFTHYRAETKESRWIGDNMTAPRAKDEAVLQKAIRLTINSYLDYHSRNLRTSGSIGAIAANQHGWNWSINVKMMSHRKFVNLLRIIQAKRILDSEYFDLFDHYENKRNQLRRKGALFVNQTYE